MPDGPRHAIVTGGVRGIGAAIARRFLADGLHVTVTSRSEASFPAFLDTLPEDLRGHATHRAVDFADADGFAGFRGWMEALPSLDVLVNNAGTNINNPVSELEEADLDYLLELNLRVPILLMKSASRVMGGDRPGHILNVASIWSVITRGGRLAYTSTKFGLAGATRTAAVDLAPRGILVNALSPGFTMTELTRRTVEPEDEARLAAKIPLGRFARPEEMAGLAAWLCGPENTYVTGQNVVVDGGYTIV